ncbi:MAG TPA: 4-hydroxyphenylacetate 3-hydroxylase C-terminal domain-containing protein [Dehalococcoidia bacterium]|nr:4-hydroxyphenylacetate 3-hydroxylase C-terminal domain-containing protein [Dehalococcoidia bacterium]
MGIRREAQYLDVLRGGRVVWPEGERATNVTGHPRKFTITWDLTGTQFGSRQALYERLFDDDLVRLRRARFQSYDYGTAVGMVERLLQRVDAGAACRW